LRKKLRPLASRGFDIGVPTMLVPVLRAGLLAAGRTRIPKQDDGTDTFGAIHERWHHCRTGPAFPGRALCRRDRSPPTGFCSPCWERQGRGEFQNGVRDAAGQGIDWTTWDGKPSGYEGYLADSFRFLQAVLLREASFREASLPPAVQPKKEGGP
jgi:hypothetical protein